MRQYMAIMGSYGRKAGLDFKFGGIMANTLQAHRVVGVVQRSMGEEKALAVVESLYRMYFEEEQHPSSEETLLKACTEGGVPEDVAKRIVEDQDEGLMEAKQEIREAVSNGIDSVPHIIFEGKKRDITLEGAKEVEEYEKALGQILKESS
ncbi:thioredoxin-like protein [Microthyrium microscopicum]|uniref:Thioredoxin-like protein n=1 Tax=Microthyrium microscopicum TaxID=703497 RepID=A0A6A6UD45_9PEZI|nr:thioredoxin-like protein [Microthyrium microscopicum]